MQYVIINIKTISLDIINQHVDKGKVAALFLPVLLTSFDTMDLCVLNNRISKLCGTSCATLNWVLSVQLTNTKQGRMGICLSCSTLRQ